MIMQYTGSLKYLLCTKCLAKIKAEKTQYNIFFFARILGLALRAAVINKQRSMVRAKQLSCHQIMGLIGADDLQNSQTK